MLSFAISIRRLPSPSKATFSPPASRAARPNNLTTGAHPERNLTRCRHRLAQHPSRATVAERNMQDQRAWHEELSAESWRFYFSAFGAGAMMDIDLCPQCVRDTSGP